jgi:hypothetical protein
MFWSDSKTLGSSIQLAPPVGTTSWHHQLAPPVGTTRWLHQLAPPVGTTSWHHQLAPPVGTTCWHHQLAPPVVQGRSFRFLTKALFFKWLVFFECLFMVKTNVRKEILAQNHFLPCKNHHFHIQKKHFKIHRKMRPLTFFMIKTEVVQNYSFNHKN